MASYLYFINKLLQNNLLIKELINLFQGLLLIMQAAKIDVSRKTFFPKLKNEALVDSP